MLDEHQVFLDKAKEETKASGTKHFPMDWRELGEDIGITETTAFEIVTDLCNWGYACFTNPSEQNFALTRLSWQ